jgi:hypothetical protein
MIRIVGSICNPHVFHPWRAILADQSEVMISEARYWRLDRALTKRFGDAV